MAKLSAVKKALKVGYNSVRGMGELGIGLAETSARRIIGNEGTSKIANRGVKRLEAVRKMLSKK